MRTATASDIPAIVRLTRELHAVTDMRIPLDDGMVAAFAGSLINRDDALALVVGEPVAGMLCASIERTPLSPVRLAVEHGWYCSRDARGAGRGLLDAYIAWAREQGAWGVRLSTPAAAPMSANALARRGFRAAETAWIMEL